MKNKKDRIAVIRELVQTKSLGSQEELLVELQDRGYEITQATLSRDLKQMQIAKVATREGGYMYVLPDVAASMRSGSPHVVSVHALTGVVSMECSTTVALIRTRPGYASSIAYDIDQASLPEVLGTIAGDDTIAVFPRSGYSTIALADSLCRALPRRLADEPRRDR